MSNSNRLVTKLFKTHMARQLFESVSEDANTSYYVFTGKHTTYPEGDTAIPQPTDTRQNLYTETYNDMLFGKKVTENDVKFMIPRHNWVSGTVYTMYTQDNSELFDSNFMVVTGSSTRYVFKCLYNNNGAPSTIEPNFNDTSAEDNFYETSDGYQWKYMYTVDSTTFNKFSTIDFVPVIEDAAVTANSIPGVIDVIVVSASGAGYNNYLAGTFNSTDIRVGGNNTLYAVSANGSSTNGFYTSCYVYVTAGAGSGQYRRVTDYRVNGLSKEIVIDTPFSTPLNATSEYEITPIVEITGDGMQTINCHARALINSASSNSIHQIEILNRGAGYRVANVSVLYANTVPVSSNAQLKVIIGPKGGHGSNVIDESGASRICFSVKFSNTESGTIQANNDFRTAGIIKSPLFANVELGIVDSDGSPGSNGSFSSAENIYQYRSVGLSGTISMNTTSSSVIGTGTTFQDQLEVGNKVLITAGSLTLFTEVVSIASNTSMVISSNGTFSNSVASFALADISASARIQSTSAGILETTDVSGEFIIGKKIIGGNSSATAVVSTIQLNDVTKGFGTFNQMNVFVGSQSAAFNQDEVVSQFTSTAKLHSINTGKMYVTNQFGIINTSNTLVGETSGSTFTISNKYPGDIVVDSGDVIYIENFPAIERASDRSETLKVIVEF